MLNDIKKFEKKIKQGRCPRCSEDFCVKHEVTEQQKRVGGSYLCLKCYNQINKLRKDLLIIDLENSIYREDIEFLKDLSGE